MAMTSFRRKPKSLKFVENGTLQENTEDGIRYDTVGRSRFPVDGALLLA